MLLLPKNAIGPPSVTMVHASVSDQYDVRMKWRVDIDFYIRVLQNERDFFYIDKPLVNVGIGKTQVTNSCLNKPEVELPEGLLLLKKFGVEPLKIFGYTTPGGVLCEICKLQMFRNYPVSLVLKNGP